MTASFKFFEVAKTFEFDAAHRLLGYQGKCRNLHGHRYKLEVALVCPKLDVSGMAVDFCDLKETLGAWIEGHWDHHTLLHEEDELSTIMCELAETTDCDYPFLFDRNPTAENMVEYLIENREAIFGDVLKKVSAIRLKLYETPTSWAGRYYEL